MEEDLTVRGSCGWVNAVVMRFDGSCVNEEGWEQGVWSSSGSCVLKLGGITRTCLCTSETRMWA